jgi:hypothetical protein
MTGEVKKTWVGTLGRKSDDEALLGGLLLMVVGAIGQVQYAGLPEKRKRHIHRISRRGWKENKRAGIIPGFRRAAKRAYRGERC